MNNSALRFILIFAIFNFSLVMSDSNEDSSQEKLCPQGHPGPKYLFYKLDLEGKILNICNLVQNIKEYMTFSCLVFGISFGLFLNNNIKDLNIFFPCRKWWISELHNTWSTFNNDVTNWFGGQHPINNRFQEAWNEIYYQQDTYW